MGQVMLMLFLGCVAIFALMVMAAIREERNAGRDRRRSRIR